MKKVIADKNGIGFFEMVFLEMYHSKKIKGKRINRKALQRIFLKCKGTY